MSEQTKIVSVICRDCKDTMTILALASATIIEGRCPECTKAFTKKQEEYNKSIGYQREPEKPSDLTMHTLSSNAVFGLEWLLFGKKCDRAIRFLSDGLRFCDNIVETEESKLITDAIRKILGAYQPIMDKELKIRFFHSIKTREEEIRRMQHFFNEQGTPYLTRQISLMRQRHKGRGW